MKLNSGCKRLCAFLRQSDSEAKSQDDDDDRRLGSEEIVKSSKQATPTVV